MQGISALERSTSWVRKDQHTLCVGEEGEVGISRDRSKPLPIITSSVRWVVKATWCGMWYVVCGGGGGGGGWWRGLGVVAMVVMTVIS